MHRGRPQHAYWWLDYMIHEGTMAPKRQGELGNLKTISKTMASKIHLVKTYAINKQSRCVTKVF